jgi:hypothetical protein
MAFDPNKKYTSGIPAGAYVLAIVGFERKTARNNGTPFRKAQFKIIHGRGTGRSFFDIVDMDENHAGGMARVARLCKAVGQTEVFDLQSDAEFARIFVGKAFKATISAKTRGEYTDNSVVKLEPMTQDEMDAADAFEIAWAEKAKTRGNDDSFDYGANRKDDGFGGGGDDDGFGSDPFD